MNDILKGFILLSCVICFFGVVFALLEYNNRSSIYNMYEEDCIEYCGELFDGCYSHVGNKTSIGNQNVDNVVLIYCKNGKNVIKTKGITNLLGTEFYYQRECIDNEPKSHIKICL